MLAPAAELTDPRASFRDPGGYVVREGGRILRVVRPTAAQQLYDFLGTATAESFLERGQLATTQRVEYTQVDDSTVVEHEKIAFVSYPYEWPAEMLHAAAQLTLDLSQALLDEGFWLKDATPYNVLFRGATPVFVDLLSFEHRSPLEQTWRPYAQFARTFLLPLLGSKQLGRDHRELLLAKRDGVEPQELYRACRSTQRFGRDVFSLVTLPTWLNGRASSDTYDVRPARSPDQARFILDGVYRGLQGSLRRLAPVPMQSRWSDYLYSKSSYTLDQLAAKEHFIASAITDAKPTSVLDIGCNEGHFSEFAARAGARVVAIDSDEAVVGALWRRANSANLNILPLVVDLARPTPAMGWRNQEAESFLERARGSFDMVLALAVIHHLLVTERAPLEDVVKLIAEMTTDRAVIEFVGPEDPMFRSLVRGRDSLYSHLNIDYFERALAPWFDIARFQRLDGLDRWLYLLRKKSRNHDERMS